MEKQTEQTSAVEVVIFAEAEKMTKKASTDLVATTIGTREHLQKLKDTYGQLVVNGIEDMAGYKVVVEGISKLKKIRTGIEKRRKELTEPALKFQRDLKAVADEITSEIVPLEKRLADEKARIDDAKEAARRAEFQRRVTLLTENAWTLAGGFYVCGALQIHPDQIVTMDEQQLDFYVNEGAREIARRQAEEQRKAAEEAQRKADEDRIRQEREAIERERAELAKLREEIEAQKRAMEKVYDTVVQPEPVPEQPLPIQDAGIRLQERSKRLIDIGMKLETRGFGHGSKKITNDRLLTMTDEEFENFVQGAIEWINPKPTLPHTNGFIPKAKPEEPTWFQQQTETAGFQLGFDNFRMQLIQLLSGDQKYTRAQIIEWAKSLTPRP